MRLAGGSNDYESLQGGASNRAFSDLRRAGCPILLSEVEGPAVRNLSGMGGIPAELGFTQFSKMLLDPQHRLAQASGYPVKEQQAGGRGGKS
jgi:hypothetical protein